MVTADGTPALSHTITVVPAAASDTTSAANNLANDKSVDVCPENIHSYLPS
jgi:hypothetical protein